MKLDTGIFIAAATAIVASIIGKGESEAEQNTLNSQTEEQRLQTEQFRLEMEEADREHNRIVELKRLEEETKRREYENKKAIAPKIPIYIPVSTECPRCVGKRESDLTKGLAICPYCDLIEPLEIERYEIDMEAFQEQLDEEERRKGERLLEEERQMKKKKQQEELAKSAWALAIVFVWVPLFFFISGNLILGLILLSPIIALFAAAYPKIRKPALWLFVFPVPLTKMLLKDEKTVQKFSPKQRYVLIGWEIAAYIGIICALVVFSK